MDMKRISMVSGAALLALTGAASAGPMTIANSKVITPPIQIEQAHYYYRHHYRHYGWYRGWHYGWYRQTTTAGAITDIITAGTRPPRLLAPHLAWLRFPLPWRRAAGPITGTHIMGMAMDTPIIGSTKGYRTIGMGMIPLKRSGIMS
jgi:hypothetical protein